MGRTLALAACGLVATLGSAFAQQPGAERPAGHVERVYIQQYPGVFIEARLAPAAVTQERWSDVRAAGNGGRPALVPVPASAAANDKRPAAGGTAAAPLPICG